MSAGVYALAARRRVVRRRPTNECNALMLAIFLQYPAARSHETSHELTWPEMMRRTRMSENVCLNRLQMNLRPAFKLAMGLAMMAVMLLSSRASAQKLGTARAWGRNTFGQLGDGTTVVRTTPVPVSGLANVTALAGGDSHSLALLSDGTVMAWGFNGQGQLGDGTLINRTTPVPVSGLANVTAIASGGSHGLAMF